MSFLGRALSSAYSYYRDINPSTLTGAIDVIVVERPKEGSEEGETELACSPFHVRFGKLSVLRAAEKKVTLHLNNSEEPLPFSMKVGEAGEAFFVFETDADVPPDLQTSPIVGPSEQEDGAVSPLVGPVDDSYPAADDDEVRSVTEAVSKLDFAEAERRSAEIMQRRRSTRQGSEALEQEPDFLDLEAPAAPGSDTADSSFDTTPSTAKPFTPATSQPSAPTSPHDHDPADDSVARTATPASLLSTAGAKASSLGKVVASAATHVGNGRAAKIKHYVKRTGGGEGPDGAASESDTAIPVQSGEAAEREKEAAEREGGAGGRVVQERAEDGAETQGHDRADRYLPWTKSDEGKAPEVLYADDVVLDMEGYKSTQEGGKDKEKRSSADSKEDSDTRFLRPRSPGDSALTSFAHDLLASSHSQSSTPTDDRPPSSSTSGPRAASPEPDEYTWEWGGFPTKSPHPTPAAEHPPSTSALPAPSGQTALLARTAAGKGHAHDGLPAERPQPMRPFSESDAIGEAHVAAAPGESGPPATLRSVGDPFHFILEMEGTSHTFELAFCAEQADEIGAEGFDEARVTFEQFLSQPDIVDDKRLVCRYRDRYLTWETAGPVLASLAIYRKTLAEPGSAHPSASAASASDAASLDESAPPPVTAPSSSWARWWNRSKSDPDLRLDASASPAPAPESPPLVATPTLTDKPVLSEEPKTLPGQEQEKQPEQQRHTYAKTLRLTSDQLRSLNLKKGANTITFSVTSSYSGVAIAAARIFYWDSADQVVISDIDGTITKSDALGHVFTMIGRDWTHLGVAKLYTDIVNNGYKILYLTSRAIGQADTTRDYLKGIKQNNYQLPDGPVIMSPDRLMASLHREVIMRKPEVFKMAALRDIQRVFSTRNPFYAGFGNRITDAMSYRSVNVPSSRIFTIDSDGEVKMELLELAGYKSSYIHMTDLVDQMFPPIHRKFAPEFTDFNYWRTPLPEIELPDLSPPSPALSARSDGSSRLSMLRLGNLAGSLSRKSSRGTIGSGSDKSGSPVVPPSQRQQHARPSSPLLGPVITAEPSDAGGSSSDDEFSGSGRTSRASSMPGSFDDSQFFGADELEARRRLDDDDDDRNEFDHRQRQRGDGEGDDVDDQPLDDDFDEELAVTGEMDQVPFL